ncbi:hypothetical protein [Shewanella marina]|uniref:hypothetical protein n=1 Tax=Shewanella marina TaxID=487319 RepID=UPI00046ED844|nr:hypothetical protein [Shewanella marina]
MKKLILLLIALIAAVIWLRPWVDSISSESFHYDLNDSLTDLKQNFTQSTDSRKKKSATDQAITATTLSASFG